MRYVSLDLETTGLDPTHHQILSVGAVIADEHGDIHHELEFLVLHETIVGQSYALNMNASIIKELSKQKELLTEVQWGGIANAPRIVRPIDVGPLLRYWLWNTLQKNYIVWAGKNFDTFDRKFLEEYNVFKNTIPNSAMSLNWRYGSALDPGVLWFDPIKDVKLPNTKECCQRAGISDIVEHSALADAKQVVQLLTKYWETHNVRVY
jgi:hypothetical protein